MGKGRMPDAFDMYLMKKMLKSVNILVSITLSQKGNGEKKNKKTLFLKSISGK